LAEAKKVADEYAGKLSKKMVSIEGFGDKDVERLILNRLSSRVNATQYGSGSQAALDDLISISRHGNQEEKTAANAMLNKIGAFGMPSVKDTGSLYKIDLPDAQIAKMLDWDKPLSGQTQLKSALDKFTAEYGLVKPNPNMTGKEYYQALENYLGATSAEGVKRNISQDVSGLLSQYGIPGIRYLDQGSRAGGKGTSNFVVFPGGEGRLNILGRE
jgi:hypothetical protein